MYHATYLAHLPSILQWGLNGAPSSLRKNYEDSEKGAVYLATTLEVARSYAECSDLVPDSWLDEIIVLHINRDFLDPVRISADPNVRLAPGQSAETFVYRGSVPSAALTLAETC